MTIKSTFAFINPATLTTDLRVQRPLDLARVAEIAPQFDANKVGTIVVSQRRDGTKIVLDGQTRTAAKAQAGSAGDVHAQIFTGLTLEDEAAMFLGYNNTKVVSALDKFLVRVTEGDHVAVEINRIVRHHGWQVVKGGGNGSVQAVAALEKAYMKAGANGSQLLDVVMATLTKAWGREFAAGNASLIGGLAEIFNRYGDAIDTAKLIRELQSTTPRVLLGRARGMKESGVFSDPLPVIVGRIAHVMHNNKKSTNKLADWK